MHSSFGISSTSSSSIREEYGFRGRRTCFPVYVRVRVWPSCLLRLLFCLLVSLGREVPGRPDVFLGRVHVPPGGLAEQGPLVHFVRGNGSHLAFNFVYSGGGSSGFEGRLSFLGVWVSRWKFDR